MCELCIFSMIICFSRCVLGRFVKLDYISGDTLVNVSGETMRPKEFENEITAHVQ